VFRKACALALGFTWPIVISRRTVNGNCAAAVGSCVPINSDAMRLADGSYWRGHLPGVNA
jgi:hypothetical protein